MKALEIYVPDGGDTNGSLKMVIPAVCICKSRRLLIAAADGLPEKIRRIHAHEIGGAVGNDELVGGLNTLSNGH